MNDSRQPGTIRINDVDLAFIERGEGDPLVFVHGSLGDYRSWRAQISEFSRHYRTVAYSRRYHWPNAHPPEGTIYQADEHADDLIALLEDLALTPAHAIGSSYGGIVVLTAALKQPELFRTIVLNEPPLFNWLTDVPGGPEYLENFTVSVLQPAGRAFLHGDAEDGVRIFTDGVVGAGAFDNLPPAAQDARMDNTPEMKAERASPQERYFSNLSRTDLGRLGIPVLLVEGAISPPIFGAVTNELVQVVPHAERVTIPDASHVMYAQNPDAYNAAVLGFFSRHRGQSGT